MLGTFPWSQTQFSRWVSLTSIKPVMNLLSHRNQSCIATTVIWQNMPGNQTNNLPRHNVPFLSCSAFLYWIGFVISGSISIKRYARLSLKKGSLSLFIETLFAFSYRDHFRGWGVVHQTSWRVQSFRFFRTRLFPLPCPSLQWTGNIRCIAMHKFKLIFSIVMLCTT